MGKLERLKWIPLLLKAYGDVQVKRALEAQQQITLPSQPVEDPLEVGAAKLRKKRRNQIHSQQIIHKPTSKKHVTTRTNEVKKQNSTLQPIRGKPRSDYKILLRELRETQKKLSRLEHVHTQSLSQMQTQIDQHLKQITEHLENNKDTNKTAEHREMSHQTPPPLLFY